MPDNDEIDWRTINGTHVPMVDGDLQGEVGDKIEKTSEYKEFSSTEPNVKRFNEILRKNNNNYREAAKEFFREQFQGRYLLSQINGKDVKIHFTSGTLREFRKDIDDQVKAKLLPFIPDIIKTGIYYLDTDHHKSKDSHENIINFHTYQKNIVIDGVSYNVVVDVVERKNSLPKFSAYSYNREGSYGYKKRFGEDKKIDLQNVLRAKPHHESKSIDGEIMPNFFEVVNLRILSANGKQDFFTGPFAGLNRIRKDEY